MGGGASSQGNGPRNLTLPVLLKRIDECMIPEERETIFDYIEILDQKIKANSARVGTEFKNLGGVNGIFKIFKSMIKDDVAITLCVQLFDRCKKNVDVMMDFIQFGGIDILDRVMKEHTTNKILMSETTKLLKAVLLIGARAAITEIADEADALMICSSCQEALERKKRLKSTVVQSEISIPTPKERIKRVLTFMGNYHDKPDVIQAGLDACISYAGNKDARKTIGDTTFIEIVAEIIKTFPEESGVIWRAAYACTLVSNFTEEIAASLCRLNVHTLLANAFVNYMDEPHTQMTILWCFDAFLQWELGPSRRRVNQSQRCMDLFVALQNKREKMLAKAIHTDKYAPYKVVVPLSMRAFMRETGGEVLAEDVPIVQETREFRKRRDFDNTAKFGVMDDDELKKGDEGLVDKKNEGDGKRDWEDKLTYDKSNKGSPKKGSNKV